MRTLLNWSEERNGGKSLTDASAKIAKGVWGLLDAFFQGVKRENDAVGFTQEQSAPNWVVLYFVIFCFGVFSKKQSYVFSKGPVKAQRRRLSGKVVNVKDVWDSFPFLAGLKNCDRHSTILRGHGEEEVCFGVDHRLKNHFWRVILQMRPCEGGRFWSVGFGVAFSHFLRIGN